MKTIGLLGGMSWESTVPYYQVINRTVAARLGGLHSARILLYSVDFHDIETAQHEDRWDDTAALLVDGARRLELGGAELLVICTNTMHRVAPQVAAAVSMPLLHIADATAGRVKAAGCARIGLLGTRFTMEQDFYRGRLEAQHGLEVLVPEADDREQIHRIIYDELCHGRVPEACRESGRRIARNLRDRGADGVILGCTELGMLLGSADLDVPLFDTAAIHAEAAALEALGQDAAASSPPSS